LLELWHDNIMKLQFTVSFRLCLLNELLAFLDRSGPWGAFCLWQLVPRLLPNFYLNFFSETHKSVTSVPCLHMPLEHVPCRYHFVYLCMLQFLVNISAATQWFHIHFQLPHIFWTHGSIDIVDAASWFYTAISGCCASLLSTLGWHIGMSQACREEMLMG